MFEMRLHQGRTLLLRVGLPLALVVAALAFILSTPVSSQAVSGGKVLLPLVMKNYPGYDTPSGSRLGVWIGGNDATQTALMTGASVRWARITMYWSSVEPTQGARLFSGYDAQFRLLNQNGIRPIVEVRGAPAWASTTSANGGCGAIDRAGGLDGFERDRKSVV
jgi:hypothetical protein